MSVLVSASIDKNSAEFDSSTVTTTLLKVTDNISLKLKSRSLVNDSIGLSRISVLFLKISSTSSKLDRFTGTSLNYSG